MSEDNGGKLKVTGSGAHLVQSVERHGYPIITTVVNLREGVPRSAVNVEVDGDEIKVSKLNDGQRRFAEIELWEGL